MFAVWAAGTLRLVTQRYRLPALFDPGEAYGPLATWLEVGWNDELVSVTVQLVAEPADDGDLVDVEPVTVIGHRTGELVDVPELVERLEAEDPDIQLATDLAAKLAGVMWLGQPGSAVPESMDLT